MRRICYILLCVLCMYCLQTISLYASEDKGVIKVCIQDEKQQSMNNVEVQIRNERGKTQTIKSDAEGMIYLHDLHVGKYQIMVTTPKGYQQYEKQELYITNYNRKIGIEMTICLQEKQRDFMMQSDAWLLFVCLCNVILYFGIYIFKTYNIKNFTQSFDDFML